MLALRSAARHGLSLLAAVGCLALLMADSADETNTCQATPLNEAYDLTLRCAITPETFSTYGGRVRFNGDLSQSIAGVNETGDVEFFQATQFAECPSEGGVATAGVIRVSYILDESGVLLPITSTEPGSIPVNGRIATCDVQPGSVGQTVKCLLNGSAATNCQATLLAVP